MNLKNFNPAKQIFIKEYLIDFNGTRDICDHNT